MLIYRTNEDLAIRSLEVNRFALWLENRGLISDRHELVKEYISSFGEPAVRYDDQLWNDL